MRILKQFQRVPAMMLCLTLFAGLLIINPTPAQAAKVVKKNYTLYLGENDVYYNTHTYVSKVSSSSKKTVKATGGGLDSKVYLSAKKTGKATVTIKLPKGVTHKLSVTVKKPKFETDLYLTEKGIVFTSTNHTKQYFRTTVECKLRDKTGKELWKKSKNFDQLPGRTDYCYASQSSSLLEQVDLDKSTVKVTWFGRYRLGNSGASDLDHVCNDISDQIKSSVKITPDDTYILPKYIFEIKLKNPTSHRVMSNVYLFFYDEEDQLLKITRIPAFIDKKKTETETEWVYGTYDHYEMIINGVEEYYP